MAPTRPQTKQLKAPDEPVPLLSQEDATVIFVLGGPGSGKGTQCANLKKDYGFVHFSAGDLLREEQDRPGSEFGERISNDIKEGKIVPMEITVQLLKNSIWDTIQKEGVRKFLIDGFPRKMDQALKFEETVCPSKFTLFFDCPEDVMQKRLLKRGETSGRADDNEESIKKRFKTFVETSLPVVEHFEKEGRVVKVSAVPGPDEVYEDVKKKLEEWGMKPESKK
ncbi:putative uridylate kinase [Tothia fuscella]|uniref:Uridylate kinase n=1 Tax=Tothia fuscella TaxID=1048955 RepID=A0A9P4U3K8_9PEZI|nr:putative uridylate kinase [Tothia fuscella]